MPMNTKILIQEKENLSCLFFVFPDFINERVSCSTYRPKTSGLDVVATIVQLKTKGMPTLALLVVVRCIGDEAKIEKSEWGSLLGFEEQQWERGVRWCGLHYFRPVWIWAKGESQSGVSASFCFTGNKDKAKRIHWPRKLDWLQSTKGEGIWVGTLALGVKAEAEGRTSIGHKHGSRERFDIIG